MDPLQSLTVRGQKKKIQSEVPDMNYFDNVQGKRKENKKLKAFATKLIPQVIETVQPNS